MPLSPTTETSDEDLHPSNHAAPAHAHDESASSDRLGNNDNDLTNNSFQNTDYSESSVRGVAGETMHSFTELINDNMIAARYAVAASVVLLTAYGLSNTPLFFRFRTVSEVPASYFVGRRRLYGRIIAVDTTQQQQQGAGTNTNQTLQVYVRHLSPVGQVLPKAWFDFFMRFSPLATRLAQTRSKGKAEESKKELLRVKIAGIQSPLVSRVSDYNPEQFLERLAKQRVLVSCQLLAREVPLLDPENPKAVPPKRPIADILLPELEARKDKEVFRDNSRYNEQQIAVCRISYRPTLWQLFATDVAETLIAAGNASVTSADDDLGSNESKVVDSSQRIQDLRQDVKYLDKISKAELEAAKKSMGMWSVPEVRESKREVVEEVEFQTKANVIQKLWRWFRGG